MPKLNLDCIRDVLLTVQELDYGETINCVQYQAYSRLSGYPEDEFYYHVRHLKEAHLIDANLATIDGVLPIPVEIYDLTPSGHEMEFVKNRIV